MLRTMNKGTGTVRAGPEPDEETILLARIRGRDQQAFRQLYEQHVGRVYALCLRLTGNVAMAEEATQDVFIRVWDKVHTFAGDSAFSTWLHRLASNVTLSYMRRQKSWMKRILDRDDGQSSGESLIAEPATDLSRLDRLILRLPERARQVFVLHAIEGMRHEEIAKDLGIRVGTTKAQFHRAKTLITEWLDEGTS